MCRAERWLTMCFALVMAAEQARAQSQAYDYDILSFQDASDLDTGRY